MILHVATDNIFSMFLYRSNKAESKGAGGGRGRKRTVTKKKGNTLYVIEKREARNQHQSKNKIKLVSPIILRRHIKGIMQQTKTFKLKKDLVSHHSDEECEKFFETLENNITKAIADISTDDFNESDMYLTAPTPPSTGSRQRVKTPKKTLKEEQHLTTTVLDNKGDVNGSLPIFDTLSYVALTDRYIDESGQITEDIRHVSLLSDESVIQLLDEIIRSDGDAVEGGGTKAIEDQIFKVNIGDEGDAKGQGTNKQEVNAVAETLPQPDGNANGQEQTGVTDDGQLCVTEGKIYMFSQTTGMWHELLFTNPPPVQVDQQNGLFSDDSDSERGNISEQVSSVVAELVGEGGGVAGNDGHDEETPKVPVKMPCADEHDREKLPVQPTCKETPKVPGQMTCAENIGTDDHNKETPNMGRDEEKLPFQQPICAENIGPHEHNKEPPMGRDEELPVQPTCEETKVTVQMTSAENIGPDECNEETPHKDLGEEKLPVQPTCAENIGPDERNEETPHKDLSECDEGKLPVQPTCEDTAENIGHDGHSGEEKITMIKDKGLEVAECICHDERDKETQPRNRDEGREAAEAIDLDDPDDRTSVQLDQTKIVIRTSAKLPTNSLRARETYRCQLTRQFYRCEYARSWYDKYICDGDENV